MSEIKKPRKSKQSVPAKNLAGWLSDREYLRIFSRVPRLCVDLAIEDGRGLLLLWRTNEPNPNGWHFPGGRVRFRESVERAAARIARTELGVPVANVRVLGVMEFLDEIDRGTPIHSVSVTVAATVRGSVRSKERTGWFRRVPAGFFGVHRDFALAHKLIGRAPRSAR